LRDLKNEGYENSEVIAKVVQKDKKPLLVYWYDRDTEF
jgi:hypothetical protein